MKKQKSEWLQMNAPVCLEDFEKCILNYSFFFFKAS